MKLVINTIIMIDKARIDNDDSFPFEFNWINLFWYEKL